METDEKKPHTEEDPGGALALGPLGIVFANALQKNLELQKENEILKMRHHFTRDMIEILVPLAEMAIIGYVYWPDEESKKVNVRFIEIAKQYLEL